MAKRKKGAPTDLVRVSVKLLDMLRAESKRTGVPIRILGDRALAAYLESKPGA